jgi:dolichol-phosphate mannosyltransferase
VLGDPTCEFVVQMDCDFSHDPQDLPRLLEALNRGADLALGSRYVRGGGTIGWGMRRKIISRGGSLFARAVLLLPYPDLTGGFKAWRSPLLRRVLRLVTETHGYGFQIETTWHAQRLGARTVQVPIMFRDRVAGNSKMSGDIVREALLLVLRLRLRAMRQGARKEELS